MGNLDRIKAPVESYVEQYHSKFREILLTKSEWLSKAFEHLQSSEGKRVRPIVATLIGCMLNPDLPDTTVDGAVVLELIHTATLIHDDVIDEAKTRRGSRSLNAIFDNRVAVLMGDFIFTSALIGAVGCNDIRVVSLVSRAGRDLTEGEIRQFETADNSILNEDVYFDVIKQKTAVLFRSCAEVACFTTNADNGDISRLGRLGELIGLAFQIRDDIFDYYTKDVGKPTGNDIREGKVTLPLLYALTKTNTDDECNAMQDIIKNKDFTPSNIARLISFAKSRGGIEYATSKMNSLLEEALGILSFYPDTIYKNSLVELIHYIGYRDK